jgi:hypothetical protein
MESQHGVCAHCLSMEHLRKAAEHYIDAVSELMAAYKAEPHPALGELKTRADDVAILLCQVAGVISAKEKTQWKR